MAGILDILSNPQFDWSMLGNPQAGGGGPTPLFSAMFGGGMAGGVPMPTPDPRTPSDLEQKLQSYSQTIGVPIEKMTAGQLSHFQSLYGVTPGKPYQDYRGQFAPAYR